MQTDERTEGEVEKQSPHRTQPLLRSPLASSLLVFAVVVLLGAGFFFLRTWNQTRTEPLGIVQTPVVTVAVPTLAAPPVYTSAPIVAAAPVPTVVPTAATQPPVVVATAAVPPTAAPTAPSTMSAGTSSTTSTPPTVDPQVAEDVARAYLRYWDVTAQALRDLDTSSLSQVATDGELTALEKNIADLRAQGKAIDTVVEHHYFVMWTQGEQAQVVDRYRDGSVFIDPKTKQLLPGEERPQSPGDAPERSVVYLLQRDGDGWKVVGGTES